MVQNYLSQAQPKWKTHVWCEWNHELFNLKILLWMTRITNSKIICQMLIEYFEIMGIISIFNLIKFKDSMWIFLSSIGCEKKRSGPYSYIIGNVVTSFASSNDKLRWSISFSNFVWTQYDFVSQSKFLQNKLLHTFFRMAGMKSTTHDVYNAFDAVDFDLLCYKMNS